MSLERGAGLASGYPDEHYRRCGVELLPDAAALYERAELIVKVKEPYGPEPELLRRDQVLFCFLHLAADEGLTRRLLAAGVTGVAFETLTERGGLPILAPMSDIAGRLAVQIGINLLHRPAGGKGLLLGGLPAAERGRVVIIGGGQAGGNAARVATSLGARVTVFERNRERMSVLRDLGAQCHGALSLCRKPGRGCRRGRSAGWCSVDSRREGAQVWSVGNWWRAWSRAA